MTTTFEKNASLNVAFGNEAGDITKFTSNLERVRNQGKLVLEEVRELFEWLYFDKDVKIELKLLDKPAAPPALLDVKKVIEEILDAQGDITTVNDGLAHIIGVDGDEVLQRVYASNLSKFVRSEEDKTPALKYYYDLGFTEDQLEVVGEYPRACIKVVDTVTVGGKEYPKGKFLKNMITFKKPDFSDLLNPETTRMQTTSIICSMSVADGKVVRSGNIAIVSPGFFSMVMSQCQKLMQDKTLIRSHGEVESYTPVVVITKNEFPELPELWGSWKGNARVYVNSPIMVPVTEFTRVD